MRNFLPKDTHDWATFLVFLGIVVVLQVWNQHGVTTQARRNCLEIEAIKVVLVQETIESDRVLRLQADGNPDAIARALLQVNELRRERFAPRNCPRK